MPGQGELMQAGLERLQSGDREGAAQIFARLLRQNPESEEAWLCLAECLTSPRQKRDCLERVLRLNPWNGEAHAALDILDQTGPDLDALLEEAAQAEANGDYSAAYGLYGQAIALDRTCIAAWIGKGFTGGMLSTPAQNRLREFFECLSGALEQIPVTGGSSRNAPQQAVAHLDPALAARLTDRLRYLADYVTVLAGICPPNMANIYAVERVHLADWAYYVARQPGLQHSPTYTREEMLFIANDSFRCIAARIGQNPHGQNTRRELLQTFKLFLLSNLNLSGLNQDMDLLENLARIEAAQEA